MLRCKPKNVNSGALVLTVETADPYTTYVIEISSDLVVLIRLQMTIRCSAGEFRQKARRFFEILIYDFLNLFVRLYNIYSPKG